MVHMEDVMKLSFMSFSCPEATLDEFLGYAKKHGYEGVEPRAEAKHNHGVELEAEAAKRAEIKQKFEDQGVAVACLATSRRYALAEEAEREESIELTRQYVDLVADIGGDRIRVFGGMPPEGMEMPEAIKIVGESLAKVAPRAEERGVYVCLETHDGFMRATDCAAAIKIADSPFIAANWDIMHPYTKGMTIDEAHDALKGLVRHCHIHDGVYEEKGKGPKLAMMGEGEIPYPRAIELLEADEYDGYLSGEWIQAWTPDEILPHDAEVLRSYMKK